MSTRPANINAKYAGEWIVIERKFSMALGAKRYEWEIEAEFPAMRYYAGEDSENFELAAADWIGEYDTEITLPSELTTAQKGDKWDLFMEVAENVSVELQAQQTADKASRDFVRAFGVKSSLGQAGLKALTRSAVSNDSHRKKAWERAGRKAGEASKGKKTKGDRMPGWPAINFRRGKKGKGASATKKAANSVQASLNVDDGESLASFEMVDGSIKELGAMGISMAIYVDGKSVWSTETLFVPTELGTKVPAEVYGLAYCAALAKELVSYHAEFMVEKPVKATSPTTPVARGLSWFEAI